MRILFVHESLGQFKTLHTYLNREKLAESWFLCASSVHSANRDKVQNILPFALAAENPKSYFYTRNLEARTQRSFLIKQAINGLLSERAIDVIVVHGSGGFPLQLFGEFDIPIVTYIEFPSFTHHGYDEKYPQPEYATYRDKIFEMTSYHQALKSDLVVVPSEYAKRMFPSCLGERIIAQMEGFEIQRKPSAFRKKEGCFHVGFAARDLSSAKGFEKFILIAKEILKVRKDVRFVFCGSPKVLYSYEQTYLNEQFPAESRPESFMQYVLQREGIALGEGEAFEHVEFSDYDQFADYIEAMDLFLYPLQFGSANWGLFELLFRGRIVIGSNRCFVPEVIRHGFNGMLCDYEDISAWVYHATKVIDDPERYRHLSENAEKDANDRFHISNVASRYLNILETAINRRTLGVV